ncbi:MAG TPA: hypothetical protein VFP50_12340 [Anaeromyxobacteraceae bacterium]|nr:hypothetical protein [Anaeromyxobacteraceae bacterium]
MAVPRRIKIVTGIAAAWLAAVLLASGPLQSEQSFSLVLFLVVIIGPALGVALGLLLVGGIVKWMRSLLGKASPENEDEW